VRTQLHLAVLFRARSLDAKKFVNLDVDPTIVWPILELPRANFDSILWIVSEFLIGILRFRTTLRRSSSIRFVDRELRREPIERELRVVMQREVITELPLYLEQRDCQHSATEQVLRLFSFTKRHKLSQGERTLQDFKAEIINLQLLLQTLPGVSKHSFQLESYSADSRYFSYSTCGMQVL
jgi:hypothetical protein